MNKIKATLIAIAVAAILVMLSIAFGHDSLNHVESGKYNGWDVIFTVVYSAVLIVNSIIVGTALGLVLGLLIRSKKDEF